MSDHQPLLQLGTPLRKGDPGYVILRLDSDQDVEAAVDMVNAVAERLAPLTVGLADTVSRLISDGVGNTMGMAMQGGLAPVLMQAPTPEQQLAAGQYPQQFGPPPAQAQPAYQQQVAPQQAQPTSSLLTGPCWAASPRKMHNAQCRDCGQPTYLTVKDLRSGKTVNAHICSADPGHKITWCEDLIWNSKVVEANGKGIGTDPRLVTG